jgi:hypothetical protein
LWSPEHTPSLQVVADDIRRERTGIHARVTLTYDGRYLDDDTFNIGRSEERGRLARACAKLVNGSADLPAETIRYELGVFCSGLGEAWETRQILESSPDVDGETPPLEFILRPYLINGGGTVVFGPPGTGKSYLLIVMAVSIGSGIPYFWTIAQQRPVYFVNLERSQASVERRLSMVSRILGVRGKSHNITFLHARGLPLAAIQRHARTYQRRHPTAVMMLDSLSRTGTSGSLVEDSTATRIMDTLNGVFNTWMAIGHTPRNDTDHIFGSQLFDAAMDIGVKLTGERDGDKLGLMLEVTKANDIGVPPPSYLSLRFDGSEGVEDPRLAGIENARRGEFSELAVKERRTHKQTIMDFVLSVEQATPSEIVEHTGIEKTTVSRFLRGEEFVLVRKEGRNRWYGVAIVDG